MEKQPHAGQEIEGVLHVLESRRAQFLFGMQFREQFKLIDLFKRFANANQARGPVQAPQLFLDVRFLLEYRVLDFEISFVLEAFLQYLFFMNQAGGFDGTFEFAVHHRISHDKPVFQQGME